MNDDELSRRVRAAAEAAYDRIERGENLTPKANLDIDASYAQAELASEFLRLCRNNPKQIEAWLSELETINSNATPGVVGRPSFPVVYWKYLTVLSQHKEVDLRDSAQLRGLLVPKKDDHLGRGLKVLQSAREGHEGRYGSREEKRCRWGMYQDHIDKLRLEYPAHSHHKLCDIASSELNVPAISLRKRTR